MQFGSITGFFLFLLQGQTTREGGTESLGSQREIAEPPVERKFIWRLFFVQF